jgi:hypothetical protein
MNQLWLPNQAPRMADEPTFLPNQDLTLIRQLWLPNQDLWLANHTFCPRKSDCY